TTNDPPTNFKGAIDEVRVWNVARTPAQINATMYQHLAGSEQGLVALWNFEKVEDVLVKDAGPHGYNGKLVGTAKIVSESDLASSRPIRIVKVLELDGTNSFVELPANIFTNLADATVEGWVSWKSLRQYSRFFDFGSIWAAMDVSNDGTSDSLHFGLGRRPFTQNSELI